MFELLHLNDGGRFVKLCEEPTRVDAFEMPQSFTDDPRDDHRPVYVYDRDNQQFAGAVHARPPRSRR